MKQILLLATMIAVLASCEKEKDNNLSNVELSGIFEGTFERTGTSMGIAHVLIVFDGSTFDGSSDREKYPAIGHGTFSVDGSSIQFANTSTWTADFDWTLILKDTWQISSDEQGHVRIWKSTGTITDEYQLARRPR